MQRQAVKREVQLIHPVLKPNLVQAAHSAVRKKRTAGYARVSTEHEEQQNSYEAQVDYYTKKIKSRTDWEFVGVYTEMLTPSLIQMHPTRTKIAP